MVVVRGQSLAGQIQSGSLLFSIDVCLRLTIEITIYTDILKG